MIIHYEPACELDLGEFEYIRNPRTGYIIAFYAVAIFAVLHAAGVV